MTAASHPMASADRKARRNALVLALALCFGGGIPAISVAVGGLAGQYLLGADKSLATLPVSMFILGTATGSIPAALLMKYVGRRNGFLCGAILSMTGALVAAWAVVVHHFWLFCLAHVMLGFANAFVQQYRFAAADVATPAFAPKAISWVMLGGIGAAVTGPQTAILTKDLLSPLPFAGAYLGAATLAMIAAAILLRLDIPHVPVREQPQGGRSLGEILSQRRFIVAVLCAIGAYSMMSFVMTAAPLAMIACNHSQAEAALGIQWHVLAMYGPSFFTGALIARFGKEKVVAFGLILLAACAVVGLNGVDLAHFWLALILLGVGWNFGFIGATAMVTETYRPEEKATVQAANDFLLFGCVAFASFMSGNLFNAHGWETINHIVFPVVGLCMVLLLVNALLRRGEGV
ncbi:MAG: MFS transporter [Flavobacteriaceae bacterium]